MKKLSRRLVMVGFALILLGGVIGPGVPYQDPTPEMLAKERSEEARAKRFTIGGCVACAFGGLVFLVSIFKQPN